MINDKRAKNIDRRTVEHYCERAASLPVCGRRPPPTTQRHRWACIGAAGAPAGHSDDVNEIVINLVQSRKENLVSEGGGKGGAQIAVLCALCVLAPHQRHRHNLHCVFARDKLPGRLRQRLKHGKSLLLILIPD